MSNVKFLHMIFIYNFWALKEGSSNKMEGGSSYGAQPNRRPGQPADTPSMDMLTYLQFFLKSTTNETNLDSDN